MTFHTTNGTVSDTDTIEHKDIKNPTHDNMNGMISFLAPFIHSFFYPILSSPNNIYSFR